ncbi:choice-of-anchor C family protein [Saccharothrix coeruleofusca]|uniref:DUF642 domain-containing protein n=1 Tax=Saccharothrix coeruleofusca TaxID=33919 RepID=A0A918AUK8_9PSEU|nr:choice-of-anchor C family protein [Saccharothrix coeruleofusca]GGP85958.1 hypothetical protein GCM10010185_69620 [Saccharothrix coeruleofusca]
MSRKRAFIVAITAGLLLVGTTTGAAASARVAALFGNGGFETPRAPQNSFTNLGTGSAIGPWRVTGGNVDLIGAGYWQAAEGDQSVDLNGVQPGAVSQTFDTIPGVRYDVGYSIAGNTAAGPVVKTGRALVDGQNFQDFTFDITGRTPAAMGYVTRAFSFVATNPTTTLTFASTTPSSANGPVLDNVTVKPCGCC